MDSERFKEQVIESKKIFDGRIISLRVDTVKMPNGRTATREIIDHFTTAVIVPVTEGNEVILTRQFRLPVGKVLLEVPAGRIEDREEPLAGAKRELLEETGYLADVWEKKFSCYASPGFSSELMHFFIARGLKATRNNPDEDELIEVVKMPVPEVIKMLHRNEFQDAKTVIALLLLENNGKSS